MDGLTILIEGEKIGHKEKSKGPFFEVKDLVEEIITLNKQTQSVTQTQETQKEKLESIIHNEIDEIFREINNNFGIELTLNRGDFLWNLRIRDDLKDNGIKILESYVFIISNFFQHIFEMSLFNLGKYLGIILINQRSMELNGLVGKNKNGISVILPNYLKKILSLTIGNNSFTSKVINKLSQITGNTELSINSRGENLIHKNQELENGMLKYIDNLFTKAFEVKDFLDEDLLQKMDTYLDTKDYKSLIDIFALIVNLGGINGIISIEEAKVMLKILILRGLIINLSYEVNSKDDIKDELKNIRISYNDYGIDTNKLKIIDSILFKNQIVSLFILSLYKNILQSTLKNKRQSVGAFLGQELGIKVTDFDYNIYKKSKSYTIINSLEKTKKVSILKIIFGNKKLFLKNGFNEDLAFWLLKTTNGLEENGNSIEKISEVLNLWLSYFQEYNIAFIIKNLEIFYDAIVNEGINIGDFIKKNNLREKVSVVIEKSTITNTQNPTILNEKDLLLEIYGEELSQIIKSYNFSESILGFISKIGTLLSNDEKEYFILGINGECDGNFLEKLYIVIKIIKNKKRLNIRIEEILENFNLDIDIGFFKTKMIILNGNASKYKAEIIEYLITGNEEILTIKKAEYKEEIRLNHELDIYLKRVIDSGNETLINNVGKYIENFMERLFKEFDAGNTTSTRNDFGAGSGRITKPIKGIILGKLKKISNENYYDFLKRILVINPSEIYGKVDGKRRVNFVLDAIGKKDKGFFEFLEGLSEDIIKNFGEIGHNDTEKLKVYYDELLQDEIKTLKRSLGL